MRRRLSLSVVLAVVLAATAHTPTAAQAPRFYQSIDFPTPGATIAQSAIAARGGLVAGGWAFDCATGEHSVFAIPVLLNLDTQQVWQPDFWFQKDHLYRPDVFNAYRWACPRVHQYEGYQLHVSPTPPPGRYRVWVLWDRHAESRDITITAG